MKLKENFRIAIISTIVLLVNSFFPVIQPTLLFWNGGFLASFMDFDTQNVILINAFFSICSLIFLLISWGFWVKVLLTILSISFLIPFHLYLIEYITNGDSNISNVYIGLLINGSFVSLVLIMTMVLKNKIEDWKTTQKPRQHHK